MVNGSPVPIEYETTSWLAYTLEGSPIWDFEIAGFRSSDFQLRGAKEFKDALFMLQPHRLGAIPVVLVHGTASSPARWAEMVNELTNDRRIAGRYEVWLFMYNTGNPVPYSAALLREALANVVTELDPEGKDPGLKQMVVMGHSQGGLLTKMTVIDSGNQFWTAMSDIPFEEVDLSTETHDLIERSLFVKPVPFVRRVVFIATPHRGSYQAAGFLGGLAAWLVKLPGTFTRISREIVTLRAKGIVRSPLDHIPTSVDNMNPSNPFVQTLASIPITEGVAAHSIIPVQGEGPPEEGDDGIVKYESAHVEGVVSEKVIRSGHSTQSHPDTIEEVRRILLEHLREVGELQK
jgi:pimeloyl-ACP methyl ester carboxylesterase